MTKIILILNLIFMVGLNSSFANGGPGSLSAFKTLGEIKLENKPEVRLVREDLKFSINGIKIKVVVNYRLKNASKEKQEITYAFPIDAIITLFDVEPKPPSDYEVKINNSKLKTYMISEKINQDSLKEEYVFRRWYVSSFKIDKSSTVDLNISYTVLAGFSEGGFNESFIPEIGNRRLTWDFSPARYWGNGKIDTINISVDAEDVINKQGTIEFEGVNFKNKDNNYFFKELNFDLFKNNKLEIIYETVKYSRNSGMMGVKVDVKEKINVTASSKLNSKYSPSNLFDSDFSTAWVEGSSGSGINEYVEIIFNEPVQFTYMSLVPGYTKSLKTYNENNRIEKVDVIAYYLNGDTIKNEIYFNDNEFQPSFPARINLLECSSNEWGHSIAVFSSYLQSYKKDANYVKKVKIIIKDIYRGSKYDDTPISEIMFFNILPG